MWFLFSKSIHDWSANKPYPLDSLARKLSLYIFLFLITVHRIISVHGNEIYLSYDNYRKLIKKNI